MISRVPLSELCEHSVKSISKTYTGKIDYIDISSIDNVNKVVIDKKRYNFVNAPSRARQILQNKDILVSTVRPNLNAVAMLQLDTDCMTVGSTGYCVVRCKKNVDYDFIFYFCQSPYFIDSLVKQATGASYPAVNDKIVLSTSLPCYSYQEQRQIGRVLRLISELIMCKKKQLQKIEDLIKSQFIEMFGDSDRNPYGIEKATWNTIFDTTTGKLDANAMVENGQYPFFTCAKEEYKIDAYAFDCEALLLAGNNAAGVYDVKHYKGKFNAYQRTYVLQLKNNRWSYLFFKHQLEQKLELLKERSIGSNTRYLTKKILEEIEFLVPSLEAQQRYELIANQADKSKFAIQQSIEKLETLKKSLMQKYFG